MCLKLAIDYPERVLGQGKVGEYEWMVIHNTYGYRCGYVRIPIGHPWYQLDYNDVHEDSDVHIHGGLTFAEPDQSCGKGEDNGWWLGFDCAHGGDAPDPKLFSEVDSLYAAFLPDWGMHGTVRTQKYVEEQCRSLCEQAASRINVGFCT
jgi:hypothetical protein